MSSSSVTAAGSRSPSPATPGALDVFPFRNDHDAAWYRETHRIKSAQAWGTNNFVLQHKPEEDQMLRLEELLERHAYDDSPVTELTRHAHAVSQAQAGSIVPCFKPDTPVAEQQTGHVSLTKLVSSPIRPGQDLSSLNSRVVCPPQESCYNLPIMFPSIPEGGTKSRVETQIRVTVDLAHSPSSSDPMKYDRVGSWKWLKLPPGTSTKKRARKQGKIDPDLRDVLCLSVSIVCASAPHTRVMSCSSCQAREAKRVAKKVAARVRPARSDTDSFDAESGRPPKIKQHEDTTSVIQFNCAEILDFSSGSVVLPLRITCYCRHHREKVGFNIHLTMTDHLGRIVGSGISKPIMITDDHKTAVSNTRHQDALSGLPNLDSERAQAGAAANELSISNFGAPSKRKKDMSTFTTRKRSKPYDYNAMPRHGSREGSQSSLPSPSTPYSPLPNTRSSTPLSAVPFSVLAGTSPHQCAPSMRGSDSSSSEALTPSVEQKPVLGISLLPEPQHVSSCLSLPMIRPSILSPNAPHLHHPYFDLQTLRIPTIHKLIPSVGPTHGGIEVTILGANFHPSLQLNCVFGDVTASSTQRWSDNTLVCVLPQRATAGAISVWFDGFPKTAGQDQSPLFTYQDENDKALMELALQVVGLKMTGQIEDARNVALRIVSSAGGDKGQDVKQVTE